MDLGTDLRNARERAGFSLSDLAARTKIPLHSLRAIEQIEAGASKLNSDETVRPAARGALVRQVYSIAGEFPDFWPKRGNNLGEVRIELMPSADRRVADDAIIARWREHIGTIHDAAQFEITRQQIGPTDRPIEIRLLGSDLEDLRLASERV